MAIRRRAAGKLVIEQADNRYRDRVRAMLAAAGMVTDGIESPTACYLLAWFGDEPGDEPVGVVGIETRLDTALVRSLMVVEPMRRRGIAAELIAAARKAAHTRGARTLYAFAAEAGGYLRRLGFEPAPVGDLVAALGGVAQVEYYRSHPAELARQTAWRLDISKDGVIVR